MSNDKAAGPDDSIWRDGSTPERTRTLGAWIAQVPASGPPRLFVKLANPGEPARQAVLTLDKAFWSRRDTGTFDLPQ